MGMQTIEELEEQRKAITAAAKQAALLAAQEREKNLASIETERGSGRDLQAWPCRVSRAVLSGKGLCKEPV